MSTHEVPVVKIVKEALSNGASLVDGAAHVREGIVVQAIPGRFVDELGGRLKLKIVSNAYLERV